ncbi:hypothetical protein GCM10009606_48160 [Nocardioides aquiterrae]|uniref:1-acyl-sn-glycerol-3-phosphate acyltransferase n=1 Tax=Nocardioides aquiterrae TaxID=203799 RepID=A0ABP4FE28_9ACTN
MRPSFLQSADPMTKAALHAVPNQEPWIWRLATAWGAARAIGVSDVLFVGNRYPGAAGQAVDALGGTLVFEKGTPARDVVDAVVDAVSRDTSKCIGIFPEGGTSGKRSHGGPHTIEKFKPGFLALAKELDFQVLVTSHWVDPTGRSHLKVADLAPRATPSEAREQMARDMADLALNGAARRAGRR